MRPYILLPALSIIALTLSTPAAASLEGRPGLPPGIHMGIGFAGASIDAVTGPISIGGSVSGSPPMAFGSSLTPTIRSIWTIRGGDGLSVGLFAGAIASPTYSTPYTFVPPPRVITGEVGLAVSYRYDVPDFFGRSLPLAFSPILTFMLDERGNVKFGPQTSVELSARFTPEAELTIGGGTIAGMRFKL